jgi:hypothetical protein
MLPRKTPKEMCFEAAVATLTELRERLGVHTPQIDDHRIWTQNKPDDTWRPEPNQTSLQRIWGSLKKTLGIEKGEGDPTIDPDTGAPRWPTGQYRIPDVTVQRDDGKYVVIDEKYDGDSWGTTAGSVNGNTQPQDYEEINRQQTGVPGQALSLDSTTCDCKKREDEDRVEVTDPAKAPAPTPGLAPIPNAPLEGLPEFPGLPELPSFPPIPIFGLFGL